MKPISLKRGGFYISHTNVMVAPVYSRFMNGESVSDLAKWFRLQPAQIEAAIRFRSCKTNEEAMAFVEK